MGVRRQAREAALQALFKCDFLAAWDVESVQFCFEHFSISKSCQPFALKLCQGVIEQLSSIDSKLTCASENWSLSRMGRVDRAILRIATYEIVYLEEVPINVAINEAIEIAKRYGADESPVFINGVLDKVASTVRSQLQVEVVRPTADSADGELDAASDLDISELDSADLDVSDLGEPEAGDELEEDLEPLAVDALVVEPLDLSPVKE